VDPTYASPLQTNILISPTTDHRNRSCSPISTPGQTEEGCSRTIQHWHSATVRRCPPCASKRPSMEHDMRGYLQSCSSLATDFANTGTHGGEPVLQRYQQATEGVTPWLFLGEHNPLNFMQLQGLSRVWKPRAQVCHVDLSLDLLEE
jgi:hypothetical protein